MTTIQSVELGISQTSLLCVLCASVVRYLRIGNDPIYEVVTYDFVD